MHALRRVNGVTAACFLPAPFTGRLRFNSCPSQLPKSATAPHGSRGSGPTRPGPGPAPAPSPCGTSRPGVQVAARAAAARGSAGRHRHARPRCREAETHFSQDKAKPCPGVSPRSAAPLTSHAEQRHGGPGSRPRLSSCRPADTGRRRRLSRGGAVPPGQGRVTTDA